MKNTDDKPKIKLSHDEAFAMYCKMPPQERSLSKLHQHYTENTPIKPPTLRTLKAWSSDHNWQERVATYDLEVTSKVLDKLINKQVEELTNNLSNYSGYQDLITGLIKDYQERFNEKEENPQTQVHNADQLAKILANAKELGTLQVQFIDKLIKLKDSDENRALRIQANVNQKELIELKKKEQEEKNKNQKVHLNIKELEKALKQLEVEKKKAEMGQSDGGEVFVTLSLTPKNKDVD